MDVVTLGAALKGAKAYTDATIAPLLGGVHYRGSVNYYNNLPSSPSEGDAYTVKYSGTSGTSPDGTEYVWALDTDDNTYKWIGFSPDTYTKSEVDTLLGAKQNTIDSNNKLSADLSSLPSWTAGTATEHSTPAANDTVLEALQKIDNNQRLDETNILLKANTSDVNNATANLQSQIDNIITPVTQDAEVENARIGADGTSYNTLKARLDAENADETERIENLEKAVGMPHIADGTTTLTGSWTRKTIISQVALSANVKYRFTFAPAEVVNKNGYGYIYDSTGTTEIAVSTTIKNNESVFIDYTPQANTTVMVKAAVEGSDTLNISCSVDKVGGNNIEKLTAKLDNLFDGTDVVEVDSINGFYITVASGYEGETATDANSCVTSYIPVMPNDKIKIDNIIIDNNRSICGYNKEREFVTAIISHSGLSEYTFTVPNNCYYIRATGHKDVCPTVTYLSLPQTLEEIKIANPVITSITNGYYITKYTGYQGEASQDANSAITDYIPIIPNTLISIENAYIDGNRSTCCYDKNKNFVSVLMSNDTDKKFSKGILIPPQARYIRITSHKDVIPSINYESYVLDNSNVKYQYANNQLFDSATLKPVLTFIDDDTWNVEYVTRHKELCDSLEIKLSFACLTSRLANNEPLQTLLHSYERQGFPVIYHAYSQGSYYNTPTLDTVAEEDDFVHGLQDMHNYGFVDYKIWCTPFGGARADEVYLAKKWGMEALITSGRLSTDINNPYSQSASSRYCVYRISLDTAADVDGIKSAIDAAIACDGWVVVSTHSAYDAYYDGSNDDAMAEIVNYARTNGVEIRTVNEELRRRMPIYNYYEQF